MKQRARGERDKQQRMAAILKAGRELWSRGGDFSMTDVAEDAGIVKGTIYLYFKTKEELKQAVLLRVIEEWLDDIDRQLEKRRGRWSRKQITNLLKDALPALASGGDMLKLMRPRLEKTAALLKSRYPALSEVIALATDIQSARSSRRRRR
ncbi:MAG TPA: helix-turn-helix domain-containing protein [Thermoanaerobaculia bacterium]|jgi:AcrR family transcriptional regulator